MQREKLIAVLRILQIEIPKHIINSEKNSEITSDTNKKIDMVIRASWLMELPGIGPKHAIAMYNNGVTNLAQLKKQFSSLPLSTQFYLKYKPKPIPYKLVEGIAQDLMQKIPTGTWLLAGSFRRKKPVSGDLDIVLISRKKSPDLPNDPRWHVYSEGPAKVSGIFESKQFPVHADIYITTATNLVPTMLYATGSQQHNIVMRTVAKKQGFMLSQYGLYDLKTKKYISFQVRNRTTTIPKPSISDLILDGEKRIFAKLGMKFKMPEER